MLTFLLTFGFISLLIVCGMRISLYLYQQGVFGKRRYGSTLRYRTIVEEESAVQAYTNLLRADAESSRYARHGLLVCLGGLAVVVILISTLVSIILH
ncbi:MAG: hypothetical protein E6I91_11480 [Chloroflexi bacterium]|nr:MAG: hypothetical protein E6I91_11480 [Chloroflexota bacterium]